MTLCLAALSMMTLETFWDVNIRVGPPLALGADFGGGGDKTQLHFLSFSVAQNIGRTIYIHSDGELGMKFQGQRWESWALEMPRVLSWFCQYSVPRKNSKNEVGF